MKTKSGVDHSDLRSRTAIQVHHISVALRRVDDGVEVHERVVPRGVLIAERHGRSRASAVCVRSRVLRRVAARR